MITTQLITKWSRGNMGAANFLLSVYSTAGITDSYAIVSKLNICESIRGTRLCVLYADLCGRDISKVAHLCRVCPDATLEDACARQDWSGRELVDGYLEIFKDQ